MIAELNITPGVCAAVLSIRLLIVCHWLVCLGALSGRHISQVWSHVPLFARLRGRTVVCARSGSAPVCSSCALRGGLVLSASAQARSAAALAGVRQPFLVESAGCPRCLSLGEAMRSLSFGFALRVNLPHKRGEGVLPGIAGGGALARVFRGIVSTSQDAILCCIGQCAEGASGASAPACADRLCAACKSYVKLTRQHAARRNPAWFGSLGVSGNWSLQAA